MKVMVTTSVETSYTAEVEIDENDFVEWSDGQEATPAKLLDYLRSGHPAEEWEIARDVEEAARKMQESQGRGVEIEAHEIVQVVLS